MTIFEECLEVLGDDAIVLSEKHKIFRIKWSICSLFRIGVELIGKKLIKR
jgi:hypothetical protein